MAHSATAMAHRATAMGALVGSFDSYTWAIHWSNVAAAAVVEAGCRLGDLKVLRGRSLALSRLDVCIRRLY